MRKYDPLKAFLGRVGLPNLDGCMLWTGAVNAGRGYGVAGKPIMVGGSHLAHRISYEYFVGPIPPGKQIDHLCRVRRCVAPDHLEPVDHRENQLRGLSPMGINAAKTHCIRGHELTGKNLYVRKDTGHRQCYACHNERRRIH